MRPESIGVQAACRLEAHEPRAWAILAGTLQLSHPAKQQERDLIVSMGVNRLCRRTLVETEVSDEAWIARQQPPEWAMV